MERMNTENINDILKNEHEDRYNFVCDSLYGNVLDLACGIGYGSAVLSANTNIQSYLGVDISSEAIEYANYNYKTDIANFVNDSALTIDLQEKSFDFIISFETLEHINEYQKVLNNFSKWLKDDGMLIGSVPEKNWENICDDVYGKNPYHVIRFDIDKIKESLKSHFKNIVLFTNELAIGSLFRKLNVVENDKISLNYSHFINQVNGSLFFIASNQKIDFNQNIFYPSMSLVEYDNLKVLPQSFLVKERDEYIKRLENLLEDYKNASNIQAKMIDERDKTIASQTHMIDERDEYIKKLENMVDEARG
jgi:2-polyprenyl-3-methyl-5-hydroxy-6-metoxy-1,4-benzoquinol methylase